ncbi:hypothetical protein SAMN04487995_1860 [Dyadobacter koreensis]|uniref:3-oxoacyl-ACP synthase n=1 Tax=Dyadobacter koreensis TaxID=408657 RepID=A0A1H6SW14_9BACT|nr:hypothetical protein [Dyadobacter koreensis]SEI71931.1 hypothetical protein SAMN04487995_1860 [Dyadobacter koreensis]
MRSITAYCQISEDACYVNGDVVAQKNEESPDSWFKQLYKDLAIEYPKFYKMDMLSQAGFLGSEFIKQTYPGLISSYAEDEVALLFANSESSADTDIRFKESYQDKGSPSPSLFVYTLPNIVLGELAIRNKFYGENMFAVLPKFAPDFFLQYGQIMFETGSKAVLAGWLGILEGKVEVSVFLIEQNKPDGLQFNKQNVIKCASPDDQA